MKASPAPRLRSSSAMLRAARKPFASARAIMLPNHAPLVIAEQFGTLESLYPNRIDLGLGRAPGSDQMTARAAPRLEQRRRYVSAGFVGTASVFCAGHGRPACARRAGRRLECAAVASGFQRFQRALIAELGLPFAFASHFAPDYLRHALQLYKSSFKPSAALARLYADDRRQRFRHRFGRRGAAAFHFTATAVSQPCAAGRARCRRPLRAWTVCGRPTSSITSTTWPGFRLSARRKRCEKV